MTPLGKIAGALVRGLLLSAAALGPFLLHAENPAPKFKVLAFYTGKEDRAHISFVQEANRWFPEVREK